MRTYLTDVVMPLIPSNVRTNMKAVTKVSKKVFDSSTSVSITTTDTVWIPSHKEMNFSDPVSEESNGKVYSLAFPDAESRIRNTSDIPWCFLRTAKNNGSMFVMYRATGDLSYIGPTTAGGVLLGFCT